jgi:hypothetical protein
LLLAVVVGCSGEENPSPTPSATATLPPFAIRGPITQEAAFAPGTWDYFSNFVVEPTSGRMYVVEADHRLAGIRWVDDSTLLASTSDGNSFRISLDGDVSATDAEPPSTFTPFDAINSADGSWSVTRTGDGLQMTKTATGRTLDVPYTGPYEWAPSGHRLVVGGGWCGNGRIAVVDPDGAGVLPVTDGRNVRGIVWTWRPDGTALALDVLHPQHSLALVDAATGTMQHLAPVPPATDPGELVPLQWNPAGTHLLFRIQGGRDCSN